MRIQNVARPQGNVLSRRTLNTLVAIWARPDARNGWARCEAKNPNDPFFAEAIAAGYLYICDARCGFEATRDGWVNWTHAGRHAMVVHMTERHPAEIGGDCGTHTRR